MTQDEIIEMALVVGTIEDGDFFVFKHHELEAFAKLVAAKALAQRTWVGLTDEEFDELDKEDLSLRQFVQAIEAKLKDKNG